MRRELRGKPERTNVREDFRQNYLLVFMEKIFMSKRILSTFVLWTALILSLWKGGLPAGICWVCLFSVLTQYEVNELLKNVDYRVQSTLHLIVAAIFPLLIWILPYNPVHSLELTALFVVILSIFTLFQTFKEDAPSTFICTLFSFVYIPFNFHFMMLLAKAFVVQGRPEQGLWVMIWLIAVAKFTDVGGLLSGLLFGKHPFAPTISPKKTWEGVIGGVVISILVSVGIVWIFEARLPKEFTLLKAALFALPLSMVAIASDLLESKLKRLANVKDSGQLIPGIGGALDLTDSLLLTAPIGYLLCKYYLI